MAELGTPSVTERAGLVTLRLTKVGAIRLYPDRTGEGVANHPGPEPCEGGRKACT
jgi:hypothetical protein